MKFSKLIAYLIVNAIVSAAVMLLVLYLWETYRGPQQVALQPPPAATATAAPADVGEFVPREQLPTRTPLPVTYVVQGGDTLGSIAVEFDVPLDVLMALNDITDPNVLSVGQTLIIPGEDDINPPTAPPPTAGPSATPLATLTPALSVSEAQLAIRTVNGAGNLAEEAVGVVNLGGVVQLSGWRLQDTDGNVYSFPVLSLFEGGQVTIHTTTGSDSVTDLYWGLDVAVWQTGDTAQLIDPSGNRHTTFNVP